MTLLGLFHLFLILKNYRPLVCQTYLFNFILLSHNMVSFLIRKKKCLILFIFFFHPISSVRIMLNIYTKHTYAHVFILPHQMLEKQT